MANNGPELSGRRPGARAKVTATEITAMTAIAAPGEVRSATAPALDRPANPEPGLTGAPAFRHRCDEDGQEPPSHLPMTEMPPVAKGMPAAWGEEIS